MIDSLAAALTVAALLAVPVVMTLALTGRYRSRTAVRFIAGFEVLLVLQAVLAVVGLLRGHEARELAPHLAYLGVSILLLPATITQVRGDDGRWAAVLVAVAFVVLAVVIVRAETTWRSV